MELDVATQSLNQRDIASINLQLLQLARQVATDSIPQATIQFGISEAFAKQLQTMDLDTISRLAKMPTTLFQPRIPDEVFQAAGLAAADNNNDTLSAVATALTLR